MMIDEWREEEIERYSIYMDFVRQYLADNTDINVISKYEVKSDRIEIEEIQKLINGNYNYQYYIKPIKRLFEMEVISYSKWVTMWLRDKKLKQLLDE